MFRRGGQNVSLLFHLLTAFHFKTICNFNIRVLFSVDHQLHPTTNLSTSFLEQYTDTNSAHINTHTHRHIHTHTRPYKQDDMYNTFGYFYSDLTTLPRA